MNKKPWLVFGAIGLGAALAGACGSDDDGGGSNDTDGTTSSTTGNPNTTGNNTTGNNTTGNSTTGTSSTTGNNSTTGNSTTGSGGGGGEAGGGGAAGEGGAGGEAPVRPSCTEIPSRAIGDADGFEITSPEFENCAPLPEASTCNDKTFAEGVSPEINWTAGPTGTLSYAITFTDVTILETRDPADPTYNQGYHYVIWDIPADTLSLPAELGDGFEVAEIEGALQWAPFNNYQFMGPCPNMPAPEEGEAPPLNNDSYSFTIYALDVASLPIPGPVEGQSFPRVMDNLLKETAIAAVEVRGTSNAQASDLDGVTLPPVFDVPCPAEGEQPENCLSAD